MIIKPRTRGFICTTAHPEGCAAQVQEQVEYVQAQPAIEGPRNVLVIGASAGYGLASRIVAAFGAGANTVDLIGKAKASADVQHQQAGITRLHLRKQQKKPDSNPSALPAMHSPMRQKRKQSS